MQSFKVSLVIPVRDEADSIEVLIESLGRQTLRPDEVILVDGGSTDTTVAIVERVVDANASIKLIKTEGATPGKGRNLGVEAARNEWIGLTDAGIKLEDNWLEELVKASDGADIVYGNYSPDLGGIFNAETQRPKDAGSLFQKCAALAYVPPQRAAGIRGKFIASSLLKKEVWQKVGGFPDMRAAEDLMFMEQAERAGFRVAFAPGAMVHWSLRPDLASTFSKFVLYSKHNVWAGRQWDWHYGVLKQYLLLVPFVMLAVFYSWWFLIAVPLWLFLRTAKRILAHKHEHGLGTLFNPIVFFGVAFLVVVIDAATFTGWVQALRVTNPSAEAAATPPTTLTGTTPSARSGVYHSLDKEGISASVPPKTGGEL